MELGDCRSSHDRPKKRDGRPVSEYLGETGQRYLALDEPRKAKVFFEGDPLRERLAPLVEDEASRDLAS